MSKTNPCAKSRKVWFVGSAIIPPRLHEDSPSVDDVVAYIPNNRTGDGIDIDLEAVDYDPTEVRRLARRVERLEGRTQKLERLVNMASICSPFVEVNREGKRIRARLAAAASQRKGGAR